MSEITDEQLLSMSDEDFENLQSNNDEIAEDSAVSEDEPIEQQEPQQDVSVDVVGSDEDDREETEEVADENVEKEPTDESQSMETEDAGSEDTEVNSENEESPIQDDLDYKETFNEIMKPIKVSGKEVQIKDISDLRNLASMGIDYSRKMRDIKPLRAIGETLKQAGIVGSDGSIDQETLTRLIDINNGNPAAIAQLLKEKEIDPLEMDTEEVNYVPESRIVSEHEIEIQEVENKLAQNGTIDVVVTKLGEMDPASKQYFTESPADLLKLEQDISTGVYDEIMGTVQYEKSLGRLNGMSDIEAYIQLAQSKSAQEAQQKQPQAQEPKRQTKVNSNKRKSAGISKRPPANNTKKTYDYLNMSDEEFEKLIPKTGLY